MLRKRIDNEFEQVCARTPIMFSVCRRSHESDRAASLLEAVRSYVGVGAAGKENNFNNLDKENSNLGPGRPLPGAVVTGSPMIRTVSTLNLRNGFVVEKNNNNNHNNNEKTAETLDPSSESADTDDVSQNSLNSSENAG